MKRVLLDLAVGTMICGFLLGVLIPNLPAAYRGPRMAFAVWLATVVVYSVMRYRARQSTS